MAKSGASKGAKNINAFNDGKLEGVNVSEYTIEDKKNVINYHKKKDADPNYKMKQYEHDSIMRQYGKKV
jgi:hypothetical protein